MFLMVLAQCVPSQPPPLPPRSPASSLRRRTNELRFVGGSSRSRVPLKVLTEESWMGVAVIALSPVTQGELCFDLMPTDRQTVVLL